MATIEELEKQLSELESNKSLSAEEMKTQKKRLRRKIRRLKRNTNAAGQRISKKGQLSAIQPPTPEEFEEYRAQINAGLEAAGLHQGNWSISNQFANYGFDPRTGYMDGVKPESYLQKFQQRWPELEPQWYFWGQQGRLPLLFIGPVPGTRQS